MTKPTVAASVVRALVDFGVSRGVRESLLLGRAGVRLSDLADEDARIPLATYAAVMRAAKDLSGDAALPLRFGERHDARDIAPMSAFDGVADMTPDAIARANNQMRLAVDVGGPTRYEVARVAEGVWIIDRRADPNAFPELTESSFAGLVCTARRALGDRFGAGVKTVHVTHTRPDHAAEYERIFGAPTVFDSDRNAILVDANWLAPHLPAATGYASRVLRQHTNALLERLDTGPTLRSRAEVIIRQMLGSEEISMAAVAQRMARSRSSLLRHLKSEGLTFERLLDDVRRDLAVHYLRDQRLSVRDAARLTGFSESAAFSRAVKRWTGRTPSDLKRN